MIQTAPTVKNLLALLVCLPIFFGNVVLGQADPCNASNTYTDCNAPTSASMSNTWYSGSGASSSPACAGVNSSGEYWVKYTAGSTYDMIRIGASTNNGGSWIDDPAFEIYTETSSGNCSPTQPTLSLDTCVNEFAGSTEEDFYLTITSGTTYYIRFFNADGPITGGGNGDGFEYCISEHLPGDFACNAIEIGSMPFSYTGNTSGYTNHAESPEFNPGGVTIGCSGKDYSFSEAPDVFFSYNSPGNEWLRVNLSGTTPSLYSELSILKGITNPCSDTVLGNLQYASQVSEASILYECYNPPTSTFGGGFVAPAGVDSATCRVIYLDSAAEYLFRMDADNEGDTTPFTIDLESYTPANGDACNNAIPLSDNVPQDASNENCNYSWGPDDPDPVDLCAGTIENTVWMSFTSDGSGADITINLSNIVCDNADVVATGPPWGWYNYASSWQFGVVTGNCGGPYTPVLCESGGTGSYNTTFTPAPNTTYYLIMDGNGGSECSWIITVSGGVTNILPAELLYFSAMKANDDALIKWEARHEESTSHYELEHSTDGKEYTVIQTRETKGAQEEPAAYAYRHRNPSSEINYYRIKQVDWDGQITYTPVRLVKMPEGPGSIEIFPNPASEQLNVVYLNSDAGDQPVKLISSAGITVWQSSNNFSAHGSLQIPVSTFSPGIYFLEVHKPGGVERQQVIIQ